MDRSLIVHENFLRRVAAHDFPQGAAPKSALSDAHAVSIFRAQVLSRCLDRAGRAMQKRGQGFYTIGSSGHEGLAAAAHALRPTDMAFLHYRDAAFQIGRSQQVAGQSITWDMLLSFACSSEDPISGGRHKVLGSKALNIPPQTSTIASHLPKALGMAYAIGAARRDRPEHFPMPDDSLAVCSFGDASFNHSTAQGAINAAGWTSINNAPLPLLFVCEDNGIGISTKTPDRWIERAASQRPGVKYFSANGLDMYETFAITQAAAHYVRARRKPAFLHLSTVRLYGHAGPDMPTTYLSKSEVEADENNDPLLHSVRLLSEAGALAPEAALAIYQQTEQRVTRILAEVVTRPHLETPEEIASSIIPPHRAYQSRVLPTKTDRKAVFGSDMRAMAQKQTLSKLINFTLNDLMLEYSDVVMMGEDIGRKGGVYGVTQKLQNRFGRSRVIDTLLDEQSILGLAIGMGQAGFTPIPEIQFLAYLHNAEDQLRGEAATLSFFSKGQFTNPMVLRIAGLGYQKGFGGHFHNDNSIAVLRDIPGLIIACPSHGADAVEMLRECVRLAREEQRVVVFLEPIALYHQRDLHMENDGEFLCDYQPPDTEISIRDVGQFGDGTDIAIVSYANGCYLSRQAQKILLEKGIKSRVVDLRWLAPLPTQSLLYAIEPCDHVLIVDECRTTGSQSEALMALLAEHDVPSFERLAGQDCFVATGPAYAASMPSRDGIVAAATKLVRGRA